ncbi:MAG: hotdog fold thioesterase [Spirochaetaceae bacterium]|nr:MAG: hotdog fold thioesterase [Spirochaetaceae bacterium]
MERFIDQDLYARYLGVEICQWGEGYATAKLELNKNHLNSVNTVHGGVIFSLADSAFSVASNSRGTVAVAIQVCISYFKAVSSGTLYAAAREVSLNPKLATYLIEVTDDNGSLLGLFQGTVYRKSARVEELVD